MIGVTAQIATAFGAGLVASFNPCVYPMIPITVGYFGTQGKRSKAGLRLRIGLFVLGQALTFCLLGYIAVQSGEALGFTSQDSRITTVLGVLFVLFGIASWVGRMPASLDRFNSFVDTKLKSFTGPGAALVIGAGSALISSPCTTPILSGILTLIATKESFLLGAVMMLVYSIGFSLVLAALGFGVMKGSSLPRSGKWLAWVHKGSAVLLFAVGVYFLWPR